MRGPDSNDHCSDMGVGQPLMEMGCACGGIGTLEVAPIEGVLRESGLVTLQACSLIRERADSEMKASKGWLC